MGRRNKKRRSSSFNYIEYKDDKRLGKSYSRNYASTSSCSTKQVRDIAEKVFGDRYTYRVNSNG
jgi:hypothetical protein